MDKSRTEIAEKMISACNSGSKFCPIMYFLQTGTLGQVINLDASPLSLEVNSNVSSQIFINTTNQLLSGRLMELCGICQSCVATMSNRPVRMLNQPVVFATIMNKNVK